MFRRFLVDYLETLLTYNVTFLLYVVVFVALSAVLLSVAESEYVRKAHPPAPHFKHKGHRWNSLGHPRVHIREPVHHHYPHRPTITVHHHLSHPLKPQVHHAPHHHHGPPQKGLVHHHHHHHLPSIRRPQHPKGPWSVGPTSNKDAFHPSPPDSQQPPIVPTHHVVDDNKGPIHTIPAPNLGPSGNAYAGGTFQTGHGIGQGLGDAGGPYPNPVYGKPATADLTYQEPKVPTHSEAPVHIPTITLQNSHSYQVHEQTIDLRPQSGVLFAPDPDPSIPAPKVPFTTDPFSHPTNGQSPPDLEQDIPQHLLSIYGIRNQDDADLGGRLLLAQALAQYDAQTAPESYHQEPLHQVPTAVSVQSAPLVASVHETVYPVHLQSGADDGQLSMYDLISNSPIQSPVLDALRGGYPSSTPVNSFQFQSSVPPQFHSTTASPIDLSFDYQQPHGQQQLTADAVQPNPDYQFAYQQLFSSSTVAPPVDHHGQQYLSSTTPKPAPQLTFQGQHFVSTTTPAPQTSFQGTQYASTSTPAPPAQYNYGGKFVSSTTPAPSFAFQGQHFLSTVNPSPQTQYQQHIDNSQTADNQLQNFGYLSNHQVAGVSVSNPGQAGYISASYHQQRQTSNAQATSASEETKTITTAVGEKISGGHSGNLLDGPPRKGAAIQEPSEASEAYYEDWQEGDESSTGSPTRQEEEYDEEEYEEEDEGNAEREYDRNVEFGTRLNPKGNK
ncbi:hypothetical protein J437_LFUL008164 [Ladona fulva]|uniref:Uncharacterized protein n=1 Tax=Ladona fulva TaxID=123851 RepID=A0A8K0P8J4_LADFU|nr:hypothetical protein J437_LFUL008164 [Ladona fulva]